MNLILRCPNDASAVPALALRRPLALVPFLGQTVLEHALAALASEGVKRIRIVAASPAVEIQAVIGRGEAWGLEIECGPADDSSVEDASVRVHTLDCLPQLPGHPLWTSYLDWYSAQVELLPVLARARVGMREVSPGVFVHGRSQVAPDARLLGPCWIGANACIGPRALVGPGSIIEDGSYIDGGAEVARSIVGPRTYVGMFTEVRDSWAWGSDLLQLQHGSLATVSDRFLLCDVERKTSLIGRWIEAVQGFREAVPRDRHRSIPLGLSGAKTGLEPLLGN